MEISLKEWGEFKEWRAKQFDAIRNSKQYELLDREIYENLYQSRQKPKRVKHRFLFWEYDDFEAWDEEIARDIRRQERTAQLLELQQYMLSKVPEETVEECLNYLLTKIKQ